MGRASSAQPRLPGPDAASRERSHFQLTLGAVGLCTGPSCPTAIHCSMMAGNQVMWPVAQVPHEPGGAEYSGAFFF